MVSARIVVPFVLPAIVGLTCLRLFHPAALHPVINFAPAACGGFALGALLFFVQQQQGRPRTGRIGIAPTLILGVLAAAEELLWRRVVLAGAIGLGIPAALTLSTVGFALLHRRPAFHLITGATFGVAYVVSGQLIAPIAAHWVYNVGVAMSVITARRAMTA